MEDYDVAVEVKKQIIEQKIALFRNTLYDAMLDAKVAELLDNKQQISAATERVKGLMKAIDFLDQELIKLG